MIEIQNLGKSFGDRNLFKNLNMVIEDKSFLVISGSSGCGKTTLINMIGGLEKSDEGCIKIDNIEIEKYSRNPMFYRDVVGFIFQNFALLENKTALYNLEIIQKKGTFRYKHFRCVKESWT